MLSIDLSVEILAIADVWVLIVAGVASGSDGKKLKAAEAAYFEDRYCSSVDRMLDEAPVDREQLRQLRDSDPSGQVRAARELLRFEPVPVKAAAEFIRRLQPYGQALSRRQIRLADPVRHPFPLGKGGVPGNFDSGHSSPWLWLRRLPYLVAAFIAVVIVVFPVASLIEAPAFPNLLAMRLIMAGFGVHLFWAAIAVMRLQACNERRMQQLQIR